LKYGSTFAINDQPVLFQRSSPAHGAPRPFVIFSAASTAEGREKGAPDNCQQNLAIREIRARAFPRWCGRGQRKRFSGATTQATWLHRERVEGFNEQKVERTS